MLFKTKHRLEIEIIFDTFCFRGQIDEALKNDNVVRLAVDSLSNERALVYQQEWVFMYSLKFHGRIFSKKKHQKFCIRKV